MKLLKKTINNLSNNKNKNILLNQYIIYDHSCKNIINHLKNITKDFKLKESYKCKYIETSKPGIYTAINIGLEMIPKNTYYIVLGAGDLIIKNSNFLKLPKTKIILFPYKLSTSKHKSLVKDLRNIYRGMPYCHNAISYLNDGSRYNSKYKISADYDHFLKFIKRYNLDKKKIIDSIQESINIEFESKSGISSKSYTKKILENIIIINRSFGFINIFSYIWHTFKRSIVSIWKKI